MDELPIERADCSRRGKVYFVRTRERSACSGKSGIILQRN